MNRPPLSPPPPFTCGEPLIWTSPETGNRYPVIFRRTLHDGRCFVHMDDVDVRIPLSELSRIVDATATTAALRYAALAGDAINAGTVTGDGLVIPFDAVERLHAARLAWQGANVAALAALAAPSGGDLA